MQKKIDTLILKQKHFIVYFITFEQFFQYCKNKLNGDFTIKSK